MEADPGQDLALVQEVVVAPDRAVVLVPVVVAAVAVALAVEAESVTLPHLQLQVC